MSNDNEPEKPPKSGKRKIRDSILLNGNITDLKEIIDNDAIKRISESRNESGKTANICMVISAASAILYFLKLENLAGNIKIGEYNLSALPFGLFVISLSSLIISSVSMVKMGDSRAYDRLLRRACEIRHPKKDEIAYLMYPNENAWGTPLQTMVHFGEISKYSRFFRFLSLTSINLFLFLLVIAPTMTGIDFLINKRVEIDKEFQQLRWWIIAFLTATNILTFWLISWSRMADRD